MKKEIKEKIKTILFDNIHRWKSTDKVSTKEFNHLVKQLLELFAQEKERLLEEFEKRIPNVKSINPSYFRDVLEIFKQKLKDEK